MSRTIVPTEATIVLCYVYLRISKDDELEGNGVENQRRRCERTLPVGWQIVDVIDENDTSATSKKPRPKYERMLADLRAGKAQAVMAFAQDRLTRKVREAEDLLDLVDSHGIQIAISGAGILPLTKGNPQARAAFTNSTVAARLEVETTGHRVKLNCEGRAKKGKPQGRVPFGYRRYPLTDERGNVLLNHKGRIKEKIDVIHEPEAAVIRMAAKALLSGQSLRSVTREIELGEIRPSETRTLPDGRTIGGGAWSPRHVRAMVTRPTYAGLRSYNGTILTHDDDGREIKTSWPPILTLAEHHRLVALFANPIRKASDMGRAPKWLLSGIAQCGICGEGSRIGVQISSDQAPAYRCVRKDKDHPGCYKGTTATDVDAFVAEAIKAELTNPKLGEPSADVAERIEAGYRQIAELQTRQVELAESDMPDIMIKARGAKLEREIKALDDEISALMPQAARHTELDWDSADIEGKRTIIRSWIKSIKLHPAPQRIKTRRPFLGAQTVEIEWR